MFAWFTDPRMYSVENVKSFRLSIQKDYETLECLKF